MASKSTRIDGPFVTLEHVQSADSQIVLVDWMLGNTCNYACSYCPKAFHDGTVKWQPLEQVLSLFDQLTAHYVTGQGRRVWLQFTGGEPTLHPGFRDIMNATRENNFNVSIISNGSRTMRFWKETRPRLDTIVMTYHSEFVDHDHFCTVAAYLSEAIHVHVNVTMRPGKFDETYKAAENLAAIVPDATISLKPLRENFQHQLYDYSDEQLERMTHRLTKPQPSKGETPRSLMLATNDAGEAVKVKANHLIMSGENKWRAYLCAAGLESLRVRGDGVIQRAVCGVGGKIGQLGGEITLPSTPTRCTKDHCACVSDILITKSLNRREVFDAPWLDGAVGE